MISLLLHQLCFKLLNLWMWDTVRIFRKVHDSDIIWIADFIGHFSWVLQQRLRCPVISVLGSEGFLMVRKRERLQSCPCWTWEQIGWAPFIIFCGVSPPALGTVCSALYASAFHWKGWWTSQEGFWEAALAFLAVSCAACTYIHVPSHSTAFLNPESAST